MNPVVTADVEKVSICYIEGVIKTNRLTFGKEALATFQASGNKKSIINC
jgi:hypothetical protein